MGILKRCSDLLRANINDLLDKAEDPAKQAEQMLRDALEDRAEAKVKIAEVVGGEETAMLAVQDQRNKVEEYTVSIQNAVKSGDDVSAKKLIEAKAREQAKCDALEEAYTFAHEDAETARAEWAKLTDVIKELEARTDRIKMKTASAESRETVNKALSGARNSSGLEAFDRLEAKADKRLSAAKAASSLDGVVHEEEDLLQKYKAGASMDTDAELARIKAEMGIS